MAPASLLFFSFYDWTFSSVQEYESRIVLNVAVGNNIVNLAGETMNLILLTAETNETKRKLKRTTKKKRERKTDEEEENKDRIESQINKWG
jgi:hypothetical protein